MAKKRTLNEIRQTKDSVYKHPYDPIENQIKFLCEIYPNDADLGAKIREIFKIKKGR